ncbi:MAG: hypothetical protein WCS99_07500, partial [Limisphaerales bacterium]
SAWDNMQRRTKTLLRTSEEYSDRKPAGLGRTPSGALGIFMTELLDKVAKDQKHSYSVMLIGHSMGSMVINELVNQYGTELPPNLHFERIVFMAAACSVRDFERCVLPYLKEEKRCNFHNLTLHPVAERKETFGAVVARGSLLQWIDIFYTNPHTVPDKVIGKAENFTLAAHDFPESVLGRIHFKVFSQGGSASDGRPLVEFARNPTAEEKALSPGFMGATHFPEWDGSGKGFGPQKHGQFNDLKLWDASFWKVHPHAPQR